MSVDYISIACLPLTFIGTLAVIPMITMEVCRIGKLHLRNGKPEENRGVRMWDAQHWWVSTVWVFV